MRTVAICSAMILGSPAAASDDFARAMQAIRDGSPGQAATTFARLAQNGDPEAQINLAVLMARGVGTPQNEAMAFYWAWRARLGQENRKAPDVVEYLERRLDTKAQNRIADKLAADYAELADNGEKDAFLAIAIALFDIRDPAKPDDALVSAIVATALNVQNASVVRDAIARTLTEKDRLNAQRRAGDRFAQWCDTAPARRTGGFCGAIPVSN